MIKGLVGAHVQPCPHGPTVCPWASFGLALLKAQTLSPYSRDPRHQGQWPEAKWPRLTGTDRQWASPQVHKGSRRVSSW